MKAFSKLESSLLPLDRPNVDTDAIIPKQYLKSVHRSGFGPNLFDDWRYLDPGEPDQDSSGRRINSEFILNDSRYANAQVLLVRDNFGCGSSREHAVWALMDYGFRVVLAPSFADIFYSNCFKNGLLAITLKQAVIDQLFKASIEDPAYKLSVDLENQRVSDHGSLNEGFEVDAFQKHCMLNGLDEIGLTLQYTDKIKAYEEKAKQSCPWLFVND